MPDETPARVNGLPYYFTIVKAVLAAVISAGLGLVFLYSGYAKLLPIVESFEMTFVEAGVANWYTAPVIARLIIGAEFFIGVLLIANYHLKKFTLPLTIGFLLFFIIYLGVQIFQHGDSGNCGCFGEHIRMTPSAAIVKNIAMIAGCMILYLLPAGWKFGRGWTGLLLAALPAFALPFIINAVDYTYTSNNLSEKVGYKLELDLLYHPIGEDTAKVERPTVELRKGKHVLAFLSLSCHHCRIAAKKMALIQDNNPNISIYFVLNGSREKHQPFLEETGAYEIPSSFCLGKTFVQLASAHLPRIYYIDNGIVVKKVDYFELNQYAIEKWIGE